MGRKGIAGPGTCCMTFTDWDFELEAFSFQNKFPLHQKCSPKFHRENLTNSGPSWLRTLPCCRACWNDSFGFLCKLPSHAFCAKRLMSTKPQLQWVGKHLVLRQERTWLTGCSKISTDLWRGAVNGLAAKNKSLSFKNAIQNSTAVRQKFFRKLCNLFP